jgi:hypothetical protein
MWKNPRKPNPLTPFPMREGGICRDVAFNVSTVVGYRFRERFSRSRKSIISLP